MPDDPADSKHARDVFAEAEKEGIDLSLLRENLRLTPTERVENNSRMLPELRSLQQLRREGGTN